jgi:hypothetical protein
MTSSIATILFTDVGDSTALMRRLGDERAPRVFDRHAPGGALVTGPACAENHDGARFCGACTHLLTLTGDRCGFANPAGVHNARGQTDGRLDDLGSGVS